jgi:hypothetical protein
MEQDFELRSARGSELVFGGFSDVFFSNWLGAQETVALDASDYEGATRIHDLNRPVPDEWNQEFDIVIDAGTLEHVFNFPVALASCLRMVKTGGCIFWSMPANNYCGHGFYQFSPELIFRVFSKKSGFQIEQLLLFTHPFPGAELSSRMIFYSITDPDQIRGRVSFVNGLPTGLLVAARKVSDEILFGSAPQQSDYVMAWERASSVGQIFSNPSGRGWLAIANRVARWMDRNLPTTLRNWLAGQYQRRYQCSLRNRNHFRRQRLG